MEQTRSSAVYAAGLNYGRVSMGKGLLLWLVGVPIPVILVLWLIFR
ncbi:hypothetical protein [Novosphingobium sp.]|nr:hypothetical protein [Novosphingobium sp.]